MTDPDFNAPDPSADPLVAWLRLVFTPGVGAANARRLARQFGGPTKVFTAHHHELSQLLDETRASALLHDCAERERTLRKTLHWQHVTAGAHLLCLDDPAYPGALAGLDDAPPVLYCLGGLHHLQAPALAVVGSRSATLDGLTLARDIAQALADQGWLIVSGLAAGIDAAAHEGALAAGGTTAAVLGTGIDQVYPRDHQPLAERIASKGLLLSEQPLGAAPARANFPRRNRIIAGLCLGVLVVQAARQSGSLITARLAAELGREVMAIPGSVHSPLSKGCHQLLRQGALLVETAEDVIGELAGPLGALQVAAVARPPGCDEDPRKRGPVPAPAGPSHPLAQAALKAMGWAPTSAEHLAAHLGAPASTLAGALLELELAGLIERLDDGSVARRPGA